MEIPTKRLAAFSRNDIAECGTQFCHCETSQEVVAISCIMLTIIERGIPTSRRFTPFLGMTARGESGNADFRNDSAECGTQFCHCETSQEVAAISYCDYIIKKRFPRRDVPSLLGMTKCSKSDNGDFRNDSAGRACMSPTLGMAERGVLVCYPLSE